MAHRRHGLERPAINIADRKRDEPVPRIFGPRHRHVHADNAVGAVEVTYQAGLASTWSALPESIRLGVLRLIGHLYTHRDAGDDAGPPAAVAALLRPWRRMKLS
jgi:uncharacterized phiE125 gp8 family phage protein